jgi:hypothetical protein
MARMDPELALRWRRLAERQHEHLQAMRGKTRSLDDAEICARLAGAERNIAGWAALAGEGDAAAHEG